VLVGNAGLEHRAPATLGNVNASADVLDRPVDATAGNTRPRFLGSDRGLNRRTRRARASRCKAESTTTRETCGKSGLFLNNRHYDPTTGVFVSVDALVTMTGEPYIYGSANPVRLSDPSGLCAGSQVFDKCITSDGKVLDQGTTRFRDEKPSGGGSVTGSLKDMQEQKIADQLRLVYDYRPPVQSDPGPASSGQSMWDRTKHSVRFIINSPVTGNSWLWAELNGGDCGFEDGLTVVCTGTNAWANGDSTLLTLGNTIITDKDSISESELAHEDEHTTQWAVLGPLFVPVYVADYAVNGRCQYLETSAPSNPRYASC